MGIRVMKKYNKKGKNKKIKWEQKIGFIFENLST